LYGYSSLSDLSGIVPAGPPARPFAERLSRSRTIRTKLSHFRTIRAISSVAMTFSEATGHRSDVSVGQAIIFANAPAASIQVVTIGVVRHVGVSPEHSAQSLAG